jgi:hypothetical protein
MRLISIFLVLLCCVPTVSAQGSALVGLHSGTGVRIFTRAGITVFLENLAAAVLGAAIGGVIGRGIGGSIGIVQGQWTTVYRLN